MTTHDDDDAIPADLAGLLADLPREIEPSEDLWEGVRREIEPVPVSLGRAPNRVHPGAWLVAGLVAAAAVAMVTVAITGRPGDRPRIAEAAPAEAVEQWESDVRQTTDELLVMLDARRSELDPEAIRVIEAALADIDSAIADVRGALRDDPGNDVLEAALAGVYQRKVQLLRSVAALPNTTEPGVGG
ncbi:MAG: hypothetical protein R3F61_05285 [Myxococcota bacterium]